MTDAPYPQFIVVAPNGNHTGLPSNSMRNMTILLAEHMLNTNWADLEALGFKLVKVVIHEADAA